MSKLAISLRTLRPWIDDAIASGPRRRIESRRFHPAGSHQMKDGPAMNYKIVGYDPPVTTPPDGFRAHDGAQAFRTFLHQFGERRSKTPGQRVVCVIMKALILPKGV